MADREGQATGVGSVSAEPTTQGHDRFRLWEEKLLGDWRRILSENMVNAPCDALTRSGQNYDEARVRVRLQGTGDTEHASASAVDGG